MCFSAAEIKIEKEKPIATLAHNSVAAHGGPRSVAAVQLDIQHTASVHRLARLAARPTEITCVCYMIEFE